MRKPSEIATAFSPRDSLNERKSFFLVGIGGAGMSALARMLKHRGYRVRGTDSTQSPETDRLQREGIKVAIGHTAADIGSDDALVVSDAIDLDSSPEVAKARELRIPIVRRSQALGWLLKSYKVIAVTGTHGKTTTTGMAGAGLIAAGLDPLVVVGASIPDWGGPVREGKGEWAVVEACEAYESYNDLDPYMVVLTNLELDHVDYHGSWENLRDSVARFAERRPEGGVLLYGAHDVGALEIAGRTKRRENPFSAEGWRMAAKELLNGHHTALPGEHNEANASAALEVARHVGADIKRAVKGIADFRGAERRLQVLQDGPVAVIDDYAHHPTEIKASIEAIRQKYFSAGSAAGGKRLIVVYQPHLYSRTAPLIEEFASALSEADLVVLTDIYPAREAPLPGVSSSRIAELVTKPCHYVPSRHLLPRTVATLAATGDVVVGMGAGNIAEFAPAFIEELRRGPMGEGRGGSRKLYVVVAYGGESAEREVSLHSGLAVHEALRKKGHRSELVDFTELLLSKPDLSRFIGAGRPDLVFLAVHGTGSEDGAIQGLLETLHLPYTGSCLKASAIAFDKELTKQILVREGIRVPRGFLIRSPDERCGLKPPLVVKPNEQGSTVGLSFVEKAADLRPAIVRAFAYDVAVLVEERVQGMEVSVPVLGERPLPVVEIAPRSGRYDFAAKYVPGATDEIVPARLPLEVQEKTQAIALRAHKALGCSGATRTDMIVPEPYEESEPVVLEVNTLPGLTATSLLPNSARAAGMAFEDLVEWMVEDALTRYAAKA